MPWWHLVMTVLAAAAAVPVVQNRIDGRLAEKLQPADLLYFSNPEIVRRMALGYESLLADLYWMRAIQYYGRREEAERRAIRYKNLEPLLEITAALDPDLKDVYRFGGTFLAEAEPVGAGNPDAGIRLLTEGIARHPADWRLHFEKGFIYFWHLRDFTKAGEVWLAASRLPDAPIWLEGLAASALSRSGAVETARALWQRQYEESTREEVRQNARSHLMSIQVDEQRWTLEFLAEKYRSRFGAFPADLEDLVAAGLLASVPKDPSGVPFAYDRRSGTVGLSTRTGMRYLKMPYDYRDAFRQKLTDRFGPP